MNANLKSANGFVRALYKHGEKIGMAAILACVGMLLWAALGVERLGEDRKPTDLDTLTQRASTKLEASRWEKLAVEDRLEAGPVSIQTMKKIPREHFPNPKYALDRPVLTPMGNRADPMLSPAEELEVFSDAGLWASANPEKIKAKKLEELRELQKAQQTEMAEEKLREKAREEGRRSAGDRGRLLSGAGRGRAGRGVGTSSSRDGAIVVSPATAMKLGGYETFTATSWVAVLAKVPVQIQYQQYEDALQNARGYVEDRDIPQYVGYRVQRALVTDSGQQDWKLIQTVKILVLREEYETYPFYPADVIDIRFDHGILTSRLPPLVLYEWDRRVSHSSMPLPSEFDPYGSDPTTDEVDPAELEEGEELGEFDDPLARTRSRELLGGRGAREPARGRVPSRRARRTPRPYGYSGDYDDEDDEDGGSSGRVVRRQRGSALGSGSDVQIDPFVWDQMTSSVLLRYFDRTALPGNRYRYRVKLFLRDVNQSDPDYGIDVPRYHLDKTVTDRLASPEKKSLFRSTEWSEPSPIASVPMPGRIYLIAAKAANANKFNDEPKAEVLVKALNSEYAAEIAKSEWFGRGSVINVRSKATVIWANDFQPEEEPEFDFHTGVTLLDFAGGESLSRKNKQLVAPTRAILMDPAGRLTLQSELDDYEPVAEFKEIVAGGKTTGRGLNRPRDSFSGGDDEDDE